MMLTTVYIVFIIISAFTICQPFSYFWDKSQNGHCGNQIALYMAGGIFNLLLDMTVVALPMPMLWGLQMATGKKVALTGVFGLGAGYVNPTSPSLGFGFQAILTIFDQRNRICIVTILRIKYLNDLDLHNITYSIAPEGLFTLLEPTLGIISACLPAIRPVINKLSRNAPIPSSEQYGSKAARSASARPSARHSSHGQNSGFAPKRFQRLDDYAYPLTDTYRNFNDVAGPENDASSADQDVEEHAYVSDPTGQKNAIVVKGRWDIHGNEV